MEEAPLPEHVDALFRSFSELLESAGHKARDLPAPEFEAFRQHTMQRVHEGERLYRDRWRGRDMIAEAREELPDAAVYGFAQMVKDGERSGDLFDAVLHAYLSYLAFSRYAAKRKGAP